MTDSAVLTTALTMKAVGRIIDHYLPKAPQALVAFDIDWTLTVPQHPATHYPNLRMHHKLLDQLLSPLGLAKSDRIHTSGTLTPKQLLAETNTPAVIKTLRRPGITPIAFTASLTGTLRHLGNLQKRRFADLQSLGVDFQSAFTRQELMLRELPVHNNNHPAYYRGILFANGAREGSNKGDVLVAFLQHIGWKPQHIVMVDDVLKNLTNIAQALAAWDPEIAFMGIEYDCTKTYTSQHITEDQFLRYWQGMLE